MQYFPLLLCFQRVDGHCEPRSPREIEFVHIEAKDTCWQPKFIVYKLPSKFSKLLEKRVIKKSSGNKKGFRSKYRSEYPGDFKFDYKDPVSMQRFISEMGKITPSRISKLSRRQQSAVAAQVKKARNLALLPSGSHAYDVWQRPEQISAKPFSID